MEIKFPKWFEELNLVNLLEEFRTIYEKRPIKNNNGGMLSTHMFYVWVTAKALKPKLIVDSGTYKGQSAWLLKEACPNSKIISFKCLIRLLSESKIFSYLYFLFISSSRVSSSNSNELIKFSL